MARLFKRISALTVAKPTKYFVVDNATIIRDLRVTFTIKKTIKDEPNDCQLTIYNLSDQTRKLFQEKPLHVRLDVGYDGNLERIFTGDARYAQSSRQGVDWETRIELGDGERAIRHARVNKSIKPGAKKRDLAKELFSAMGLKPPTNINDITELATQVISGEVFDGTAAKNLTKLFKPHGLDWSIQDGRGQVLRQKGSKKEDTTYVRPDDAFKISQSAGMIGVPELTLPKNPKERPLLKVKTLLYPRIMPGGVIQLDSESLKGLYKIQTVVHNGDTHGTEWTTEIEATPL